MGHDIAVVCIDIVSSVFESSVLNELLVDSPLGLLLLQNKAVV